MTTEPLEIDATAKRRSLVVLLIAQVAALSLWFISAAILPDMLREVEISDMRQAALSSAVQAGFVVGAIASALFGLSDRFDPRRFFAGAAILAAIFNLALLVLIPGSVMAISARFLTGVCLACVYPVGMRIAVGWGQKDRGFLVSALVGALVLGSALPHLFAIAGGGAWRHVVAAASLAAFMSGLLVLRTTLGPFHQSLTTFEPRLIFEAWTNKRVRLAYIGYLGHMWELYAMWAWIGVIAYASFSLKLPADQAQTLAMWTAFATVAIGAPACFVGGWAADRVGKAEVAIIAMIVSGLSAFGAAAVFGGPVWLCVVIFLVWGASIIPDSALFSALVADAAPAEWTGSLMTLQTALGFALTIFTVQLAPLVADAIGWPLVLCVMGLGPVVGILAMLRLCHFGRAS